MTRHSSHGSCSTDPVSICAQKALPVGFNIPCVMQVRAAHPPPRKSIAELTAQGRWMAPRDLIGVLDMVKQNAEEKRNLQGWNLTTARLMHDAALVCCMFGYMPPIRLSCLRTLLCPGYQGGCPHPDCSRPECKGNRLVVVSTRPAGVELHLPHHKNEGKWDGMSITFRVPPEVAEVLLSYLGAGHALLDSRLNMPRGVALPFVFMTNKGRPFDSSSFNHYWQTLLLDAGGARNLPPSRLRHIFVDERRSVNCAPGPADRGAAMIMGNSEAMWDRIYDTRFHEREAQHAIDNMGRWRHHLLQSPVPATLHVAMGAVAAASATHAAPLVAVPNVVDIWKASLQHAVNTPVVGANVDQHLAEVIDVGSDIEIIDIGSSDSECDE